MNSIKNQLKEIYHIKDYIDLYLNVKKMQDILVLLLLQLLLMIIFDVYKFSFLRNIFIKVKKSKKYTLFSN